MTTFEDRPARRLALTIGAVPFATKAAALTYTQALIARQPLDTPIHGADQTFLGDLLSRHPRAEDKIGPGIAALWVRLNPAFPASRQLMLRRLDGSVVDISWHQCLRPRPAQAATLQALREAIVEQVMAVKRQAFLASEVRCPITGVRLTPETCHVDHAPPLEFWALVALWLAWEFLTLAEVAVEDLTAGLGVRTMADAEQRASWQAFHAQHAQLRVLSIPANLTPRRKASLVELGQWALGEGREDLVFAVTLAIRRERLGGT